MLNPLSTAAHPQPDDLFAALRPLWLELRAHTIDQRNPLFPEREFELLAKYGVLSIALPESLDGFGLGLRRGTWSSLLRLLRCLGFISLPLARVFEGHVNALHLLELYGDSDQLARAAVQVREHRALSGVWNTDHFSRPVKLDRLADGSVRLSGAKAFASGAGYLDFPIATGEWRNGNRQMFLLNGAELAPRIDLDSWHPFGMRESASYHVDLDGLDLPPNALIGIPGDYYREPVFSAGAIRFTAAQLGAAERLLFETQAFLMARNRQSDPYQLGRISEMTVAVETGRHWIRSAAEIAEESFHLTAPAIRQKALLAHTAMTRVAIEALCMRVMELAERSVGAQGLLEPHPFGTVIANLRMYLRQPAPDAALASVGRALCDSDYPRAEPF